MIHLSTLGIVRLHDADRRELATVLTQPKRLALLTYLAADRDRTHHRRDALVALFWPESDSDHAYRALRQSLYFLRRAMGEDVFIRRGDEEVGVDSTKLVTDVQLFWEALARGANQEVVSLYRGPFLHAFAVRGAPEFERWVEGMRANLQREYAVALKRLAREAEGSGDVAAAGTWWRKLVALDPYSTEYAIGLMRELAESGDAVGALRLADEHAGRLMRDLGLEAPPELHQATEQIRNDGIRVDVGTLTKHQKVTSANQQPGSALTHHHSGPHRSRRYRPAIIGALGVAALLSAWVLWRAWGPEPAVCDVCVAVFPFALTGPDSLEMWQAGAALLLNQDLDGAGQIRTVDHNAIASASERLDTWLDPPGASRITSEWGSWYVLGNLLALGDRNRLTAALYRVDDSTPIASAMAEGTTADMPRLTQQLAAEFILHVPLGEGQRLANPQRRTEIYESLKAYLRGEQYMRRKEFDSATASFDRAIALDSTFGLPRLRRVFSRGWVSATAGRVAAEETHAYRGQLSGLDSLLFEASYAFQTGRADDAERITRDLVSRYPSNVEAWWLRGGTIMWFGWRLGQPMNAARPAIERVLTFDPNHSQSRLYLNWIAAWEGNIDEFEALQVNPYARSPYWERVYPVTVAFARADIPAQDSMVTLMNGDADWVVNLIALSGATAGWFQDLTMVSRVSELLTDASRRSLEARLLGWLRLSRLELARGRWRQATDRLDSAALIAPALSLVYRAWFAATPFIPIDSLEIVRIRDDVTSWDGQLDSGLDLTAETGFIPYQVPPDMAPHIRAYLIALLSSRLGDHATAKRSTDEIFEAITPLDTFDLVHDMAVEVAAYAQMAVNDPDSAMALLQKSKMTFSGSLGLRATMYMRALSRLLRADILYARGEYEEAAGWFSTFAQFRASHWSLNPWSHYRRGQIYDELGDHEQAIRNYTRFVEQWRDAAPELQHHVTHAKERLAALVPEDRQN